MTEYYKPFFIYQEGWFFVIPQADMPRELSEGGDCLAGPWASQPEALSHADRANPASDFHHSNDNGGVS